METADCIFCKIVNGKVATEKLLDNDQVVAFYDISPSADVHVLIAPKKHVASFIDLEDLSVLDAMRQAGQQLIRQLNLENAYKLVFNGGAYQHVPHLHWHLLGGKLLSHP